jgi:hypothetical protein
MNQPETGEAPEAAHGNPRNASARPKLRDFHTAWSKS